MSFTIKDENTKQTILVVTSEGNIEFKVSVYEALAAESLFMPIVRMAAKIAGFGEVVPSKDKTLWDANRELHLKLDSFKAKLEVAEKESFYLKTQLKQEKLNSSQLASQIAEGAF